MQSRPQPPDKDKGTGLIEFALASVTILTVLFGIIDVGRAAYAYDWISNAARLGARFMIVRGTNCINNPVLLPGGCPATAADSTNYITNSNGTGIDTSGIDTRELTVTTTCFLVGHTLGPPPCAPTGWLRVQIQYNFKFLSPFIPLTWQMQSTSQEIVQN